jgi:hypothetical protein
MKTIPTIPNRKNAINTYITQNDPSAIRIVELETQSDIPRLQGEVQKFIGRDLSSVSIIMLKR